MLVVNQTHRWVLLSHIPCGDHAVSESGRPLQAVINCWKDVWGRFKRAPDVHQNAMCLLLGNPFEVVELACKDAALAEQLHALLATADVGAEHWQQLGARESTPLLERIKWLKSPSWRYRSEVLGLVDIGVSKVTNGAFTSVDQVHRGWLGGVGCVWGWRCLVGLRGGLVCFMGVTTCGSRILGRENRCGVVRCGMVQMVEGFRPSADCADIDALLARVDSYVAGA
jgi:hypothetical protein